MCNKLLKNKYTAVIQKKINFFSLIFFFTWDCYMENDIFTKYLWNEHSYLQAISNIVTNSIWKHLNIAFSFDWKQCWQLVIFTLNCNVTNS